MDTQKAAGGMESGKPRQKIGPWVLLTAILLAVMVYPLVRRWYGEFRLKQVKSLLAECRYDEAERKLDTVPAKSWNTEWEELEREIWRGEDISARLDKADEAAQSGDWMTVYKELYWLDYDKCYRMGNGALYRRAKEIERRFPAGVYQQCDAALHPEPDPTPEPTSSPTPVPDQGQGYTPSLPHVAPAVDHSDKNTTSSGGGDPLHEWYGSPEDLYEAESDNYEDLDEAYDDWEQDW
ncbi:hypothetical protein [Pseudoflavonifractor sp. MSJ-37]|uniref:hypothetical protein n=1 Tax=Pseudoflavonifractor sp. MSJ-37 TaxID=2841531 RepID=UPI001C10CAC4|nr:hypothetical protein [Pseudoflavonifractor sp. MSJ-37]MBU5434692.1 hypothetical protein [Pseudoflavonifractor sp. MSJ-37]